MYEPRRSAFVLVCAALAAGGASESAHAGTASGQPARFTASAGEQNALTVDQGAGGAVRFVDAGAPVVAGSWCSPVPLGEASCDPDGDPRDGDGGGVHADLGDESDRAIVRWIPGTGARPGTIDVRAGAGDDRIENVATAGAIRFAGGDGDDTLVTGPSSPAWLLGGAGADLMSSSGCCAVASYEDHGQAGVRVTLDQTANDGVAGERDDVRTTGVIGGPGPDVIRGDAAANALTGSGGADVLAGRGGDDSIDATLASAIAAAGADGVNAVTCGAGRDDVVGDENDRVATDCEWLRVGFSGPELVLVASAARAARTGSLKLTYRVKLPSPVAPTLRSTLRLVDRKGRSASSRAQFVLGGAANSATVRVRLNRTTRRRLARSRAGRLRLIARRVSRSVGPETDTGYEQWQLPVTVRRR